MFPRFAGYPIEGGTTKILDPSGVQLLVCSPTVLSAKLMSANLGALSAYLTTAPPLEAGTNSNRLQLTQPTTVFTMSTEGGNLETLYLKSVSIGWTFC
jgi:hypothetical protein